MKELHNCCPSPSIRSADPKAPREQLCDDTDCGLLPFALGVGTPGRKCSPGMDLNPAPFRGDSGIPHVSEEFFKMTFIGANVRSTLCRAYMLLPYCTGAHGASVSE